MLSIFKKKRVTAESLDSIIIRDIHRFVLKQRTKQCISQDCVSQDCDYVQQLHIFLENNSKNVRLHEQVRELLQRHWEHLMYTENSQLPYSEVRMQVAKRVMADLNNR